VQLHLSLPDGRKVPIPLVGDTLQTATDKALRNAHAHLLATEAKVAETEAILTASLGLDNWQPPERLTYTRRASEVFGRERFDAEHYQEQYFALAEKLRSHSGGCDILENLCPDPVNGVEIREYADEGVPYLRVGDLHDFTVSAASVKRVSASAAADEIEKVRLVAGDVLVSRSGSLAVTGVIEPEWAHSVISSHLIRVRISNPHYDPYYVAAFLAAMPGKMQIIQQSNGGVQPEINQPALKRILIPRLSGKQQRKVRESIHAAHATRQRAHELLAAAQRAVEIAIEDSETTALAYLEKQSK
jgi:type I restriction enzyme M protein